MGEQTSSVKTLTELEIDFLAAMRELENRDRRCYKPYQERLTAAKKAQGRVLKKISFFVQPGTS